MKELLSLNPKLIGYHRPQSGEGLQFDCPSCGPKHRLTAYFKNPVDGGQAAPEDIARWQRIGSAFDELTVDPSIKYPCAHGWVNAGRWFDMNESPLVAVLNVGGRQQIVALSPVQTLAICEKASA